MRPTWWLAAPALALTTLVAATGCACSRCALQGDDPAKPDVARERARPVRSLAEARAAIGHRVRVEGTAGREKLGDSVDVGGMVLICLDHRFGDDRIGRAVSVEGVLDETRDFQAVRGPRGEVSQGTESDAPLLVLRGCESLPGLD